VRERFVLFFLSLLSPHSLMIDSLKLHEEVFEHYIDNEQWENAKKNPFLVDRTTKGGATPRSSGRHREEKHMPRHRRHARCHFRDFFVSTSLEKLASSALQFVEGPSKISLQVIRPDLGHNPHSLSSSKLRETIIRYDFAWCVEALFLQLSFFSPLRWYTLMENTQWKLYD